MTWTSFSSTGTLSFSKQSMTIKARGFTGEVSNSWKEVKVLLYFRNWVIKAYLCVNNFVFTIVIADSAH